MKAAPQVEVSSRQALREWLLAHHAQAGSIWLVTFKKAAGARHLPPQVIVEEALAFGWIDSVPRALDAERTMRLLSPRRAGSAWSKVNKRLVAAMTARGEMHAAGLAKVAAAKADGSWFKLDAVETLALPEDLSRALDRDVQARTHFLAFPPSTRRAILEWIGNAKATDTRARRVAETVLKAHDNLRANQYRQPKGAAGKA